jgi:hypothetical protein
MAANCPISSFSNFGWSIDINKLGSGVLIGVPKTNVLVDYERKNLGTTWYYVKYKDFWRKFPLRSPVKNGEFGKSVAINDDNLIAIGEPYYSNTNFNEIPFDYGFGAVHLYKFNNTAFPNSEFINILTGNGRSLSQFGYSIDLNSKGDILVVGAPTDVTNNITGGKVYVYKNTNDDWNLEHTLTGGNNFGYFGKCVKINNGDNLSPNSLIVVAENKLFHIYDYNNNVVTKTNTFNLEYDNFQTTYNHNYNKFIDTDIEGNTILIGNPYKLNGLAKLYAKTSIGWNNILNFSGDTNFQFFGASVGLSNIISAEGLVAPNQPFATEGTLTSFRVNWNSVPGALYYLLDISTNSNFSSFVGGYNNFIGGRTNQLIIGLTPGTTYYVRVRTANATEVSANSPTLIQTVGVATPAGLTATNIQTDSFTANWSPAGGAFNYRLDVSTASNFATRLAGYDGLTVNGTSQSITGLTAGTTYYVRVRAVNSSGLESANSSTLTQSTVPVAPNAPTISSVTAATFTASWNSVTGASEYRIDVATTSNFTGGFVTNYNDRLVSGTSESVIGLSAGTTYYVRVRARNTLTANIVTSAPSPNAEQITLTLAPSAPTATNITETGFTANWNSVTGAASYRLDVSSVSNFATRLAGYDGLTVNGTSQSITGLTAGTTYYVRVRAVNSSGLESANSSTLTQSTVPVAPNAPTISSVTAATFTASWNSVTGASEYRIDVATTSNFTGGFVTNYNDRLVSGTSESVIGLSAGTTYYVRVRARNTLTANIVTSAPSPNAEQITLTLAPSAPTATNITETGFTANWNSVTGAASYRLDVSSVSNFATRLAGYDGLTVNGTSQSITGLTAGTTYYVRVRAVNSSGLESANSSTLTQSTVPVAPNAPTISSVTAATFTATWNSVAGASEYRVDVATTSNFTGGFVTNYNDRLVSGTSVSVIGLSSGTTYYVRVRARNTLTANIVTSASSLNAEGVTVPSSPSTPTATNITETGFTANWNSVTGATSYRLDVSTASNFATRLAGYDGLTVNGTSQSITGLTAGTTYYVRVRAVNSSGLESANSSTLTQSTVPVAPNAPTISSVTAATFTATWNSVAGASEYRVDVATTSNFTGGFVTNYNDRLVSGTSVSVIGLSSGTTYYVRVRARNTLTANIVTSASSLNAEGVTVPSSPSTPTATNITETGFTANWNSVTGATSYRLDVSTASNFATRLAGYDGLTVNGTSQSITGLTAGTTYYVRVRAVNSSGLESANSSTLTQSTVPVAPNAPTISSVTAATFTATWNSVAGASEYRVDVATTSNFTGGFVTNYNDRLVSGTSVSVIGLSSGTTYYVRVRARNTLTANIVTSASSLNAEGVTVPSSPSTPTATNITETGFTANWNSVTGATSYSLDVSTDFSFITLVPGYDRLTVNGTSQSVTGLNAGTIYYVRVRAVNSIGLESQNIFRLTLSTVPVAPNAPIVARQQPYAATVVSNPTFILAWNSVAGASEYRIDIATTSDFTGGFVTDYNNRLVSETIISITGLSAETIYYARVRAVNTLTVYTVTSANSQTGFRGPAQLVASNITTNAFNVNWSPFPNATSYRVDIAIVNNLILLPGYDNLTVNGTSLQVTGLSPGINYDVRIRAVTTSGLTSSDSQLISTTVPLPPTVVVSFVTSSSIWFQWAAVDGAFWYRVDIATSPTFESNSLDSTYNNFLVEGGFFIASGLRFNTTYYIRVRTVNAFTGNILISANSATVSATPTVF